MIVKVFYSRKYNELFLADVRGFKPMIIEILGKYDVIPKGQWKGLTIYIKPRALPKSYVYIGDYE